MENDGTKKVITIVVILLVVLGLGYYLFKISPDQQQAGKSGYNAALTEHPQIEQIKDVPAFDPATDHYLGNPKAKNVFIEYGDMQCPYCATANPMLTQIASKFTDTVFVFRYFPLLQHQNTVQAGLAAEAAGAQGKYWEMHDILFAKQTEWETVADPLDLFVLYAQSVGVQNIDQFKKDVTEKKYLTPLQKGLDEAYALRLTATPSYFFNNKVLEVLGNTTIDSLKAQAEKAGLNK